MGHESGGPEETSEGWSWTNSIGITLVITCMKAVARSHAWWPSLDPDVEELAKSCLPCQEVKQAPVVAPLHPWVWSTKPWSRIHMDFTGPFMGTTFFVAVDTHSKWPEVYKMASATLAQTITVLRHLFAKYGIPKQQVLDNGPQFTSDDFRGPTG